MLEYIKGLTFSAEVYGMMLALIGIFFLSRSLKKNPELKKKWDIFVGSLFSRKYFAWAVITVFFWFDHFVWLNDGISFIEYAIFTCGVFGIDVADKYLLRSSKKDGEQ